MENGYDAGYDTYHQIHGALLQMPLESPISSREDLDSSKKWFMKTIVNEKVLDLQGKIKDYLYREAIILEAFLAEMEYYKKELVEMKVAAATSGLTEDQLKRKFLFRDALHDAQRRMNNHEKNLKIMKQLWENFRTSYKTKVVKIIEDVAKSHEGELHSEDSICWTTVISKCKIPNMHEGGDMKFVLAHSFDKCRPAQGQPMPMMPQNIQPSGLNGPKQEVKVNC